MSLDDNILGSVSDVFLSGALREFSQNNPGVILDVTETSESGNTLRVTLLYEGECGLDDAGRQRVVGELAGLFRDRKYNLQTECLLAEAGGVDYASRNT